METSIVRIGNSQGLRIPKPLLEQVGITRRVRLRVQGHCLMIEPVETVRNGWAERFDACESTTEDQDWQGIVNAFDETEWTW